MAGASLRLLEAIGVSMPLRPVVRGMRELLLAVGMQLEEG
jgi:hypothetical protein